MNSKVLRTLSYGVYIVSTMDGERPTGCTANSAMQITSSPATIAVSINHDNYTNHCIDAFEMKSGVPIITDSCGYIVCKVINKMETSSHTVFLGEVIDGDVFLSAPAMTYAYYHNVIKGKSPKTAPTYIPEEESAASAPTENTSASKWVCSVCGYIYDGDTPFEELPDDFVCPLCKQPKDKFKLQEVTL